MRKTWGAPYAAAAGAWEVRVAWHSAWRVLQEAAGAPPGEALACLPVGVTSEMFVTDPDWLLAYGRSLAEAAVARGELREDAVERLTSYQFRAFALGATRSPVYLRWAAGGGKTLGALGVIMSRLGTTVVLCPAKARKEWRSDRGRSRTSAEIFTNLETHVILPPSDRSADYEPTADYLARMRDTGKRAVLVAGMESVGMFLDEIRAAAPSILVVDEIHDLGSSKRVDVLSDAYGNVEFPDAKTPSGEQKRVLHAVALSAFPTLQLRCGLTATPIGKSPNRLWSQADILGPGGFGPYSAYRVRYCDYRPDDKGYYTDEGVSHVEELRQRFAFFTSDVPRSVTHAELPPFRPEVRYLAPPHRLDIPEDERQNRPDAFSKEIRRCTPGQLREVRTAEAASRKRRACLGWTRASIEEGGKVVIFMTRKALVERWAEVWRGAFPGVDHWTCTGDDSERARDRAVDAFTEHPGPCWLLATGHSIGTSKNGMQTADLGIIAQLPDSAILWIQWLGRWDRKGGRGTRVIVPVAEETYDEVEVSRLIRAFGPIEKFTDSPELREMGDRLAGGDDPRIIEDIVAKICSGGLSARDHAFADEPEEE